MTTAFTQRTSWQLLRRFWPFYFKDRALVVASYAAGLAATVATIAAALPLKYLIDSVLAGNAPRDWVAQYLGALQKPAAIGVLAVAIAAFAAAAAAASALEKTLNARLREKMTARLREALLADILCRPLAALASYRAGEVTLRLIDDTGQVARLFCKTAPVAFRHIATTILTLGAMAMIHPALGALGLFIIVSLAFFVRRAAGALQETSREKRAREGAVSGFALEIVRNVRFIRAAGGESETQARFKARNNDTLTAGVRETRAAVSLEQRMQIANGFALAIITGAGGYLALRGSFSVGDLALSLSFLTQLLKPVEKINDLASSITGALVRAERLDGFHAAPRAQARIDRPAAFTGPLRLEHVRFGYGADAPILNDVSFTLLPGHSVWVRGASGAGKSTLIDIILRLYEASEGSLSIGATAAADLDPARWRTAFGVMLQDRRLLAGTIREAVEFGNGRLSDEQILSALMDASLAERVATLADGVDAVIGEEGGNFSGGERARLCLARALASQRPILILDEPLANLDLHSQREVLAALARLRGRRTLLIVSHQPIPRAAIDRVIDLENGVTSDAEAGRAAS